MGCKDSKPALSDTPAVVAGSTVISGRSVMILGDSLLLPMRDQSTNESSVVEIDLKNKNVKVLRGVGGRMTHRFVNNSRKSKKCENAFIDVESDGEMREESFQM